MLEHSYTKGEGQGLSKKKKKKSYRLLSQLMDTQGGRGRSVWGVGGIGSGHMSQEVTPAMPDYKQCALSTSAALAVEHTTSGRAKGVALEGRGELSFSLLCLLNATSIQWVARGEVGVEELGQEGTSLMKSRHVKMDENWVWRVEGAVVLLCLPGDT